MPKLSLHDNFIRAVLADKALAVDYFLSSLPAYVTDKLDFTSLTQLPDTYISESLQKTVSDIVYSCGLKDGKGKVKISLLLEHKSSRYRYTPVQLGSYIFSGFLKQLRNKEELSPIIPVLLYHGKKHWEYATLADLFGNLDPAFRLFIPDYHYVYHHLGEISDEMIESLNNKFLAASFFAMKYSLVKDELRKWIPTILSFIQEADLNLQNAVIVYTFECSGLSEEQILAIINSIPVTMKTTSTLKNPFVEIGRKEKTRDFTQSLIRETDFDDARIAKLVGVSRDFVAQLRKELHLSEKI